MKKWLISFVLILGIIGAIIIFLSRGNDIPITEITNYPPKNETIVAFGDSLVEGIGAHETRNFVAQLEQSLGTEIINEGVAGDTTADGLGRINNVLQHDPGIVLLLLGGNDFLQNIPSEETFRNLGTIIQQLHNNGVVVVILGIRGGVAKDGYKDDFEQLAKDYNTVLVPNVLDGLIGNVSLMDDPVHPNERGYAIIAEKIKPVLIEILNK